MIPGTKSAEPVNCMWTIDMEFETQSSGPGVSSSIQRASSAVAHRRWIENVHIIAAVHLPVLGRMGPVVRSVSQSSIAS